jgi:CHAT domain-containing protein
VSRREVGPATPQNVFLIVRQETSQKKDLIEYGCSVLTAGSKATVFKANQTVKKKDLDNHLAKLGTEEGLTHRALPKFGDTLASLVLPPNILTVLERQLDHPLVVVHDALSSRVPWETLRIGGKFPALQSGLSHRYEAENLSIAKWLEERQRSASLNVLVVINPTEDLPGAKAEGDRILALLGELKPAVVVQSLVGKEAHKAAILNCIRSGKFDVIHYAGHAFFDTLDPSKSGILCAGEEVLAGAELANIGGLPSLVFFNACESGRLRKRVKTTPVKSTIDRVHRGVSFAEAFLRGGIANYLGTYWPVNDNAALKFSETFYRRILNGETLGAAIMAGRKAVEGISSVDWADYILYGDTNFVLKVR